MKVILFYALLTFTTAYTKTTRYMHGGLPAEFGQFPYQASLECNKIHKCSGAIINERWIVTTATCSKTLTLKCMVMVGGTNLICGVKYKIKFIIQNPDFAKLLYDIAMIKVNRNIKFMDIISPIYIDQNRVGPHIEAIVSGWGDTEKGATSTLMYTYVITIDNDLCEKEWKKISRSNAIAKNQLCTNAPRAVGVCRGDSGAPLVLNGKLIGLVSKAKFCALGVPDVYERVEFHKSWIRGISQN